MHFANGGEQISDFYDAASGRSFWRGYWYYKNGNVLSYEKISEDVYQGKVKSDSGNIYDVSINLVKPFSSKCSCPYAEEHRRVCKHMVALYFAVFPNEVKEFDEVVLEYEQEQERKQKEYDNRANELRKDVETWSRERLINYVVSTLMDDYSEYDEDDEYSEIFE